MISWTNWSANTFSFVKSESENYRRIFDESSKLAWDLFTMVCELGPTQPPQTQLLPCDDTQQKSAEEDPELHASNTIAKIQRLIHNEICELLSIDANALSAWRMVKGK